ncbi:MAG TPA: alpha/beta fold hydrolase [Pirellulales bacterium]|jgi:pimeloyl-ACP methyl ester carboxylesterase|nr:alpha/beta fold hydrolase [Pirellulales bacterium]
MKQIFARELEFGVVDQGEGSPLVFVHGFPLNHSMWNAQIPVFASRQRVIAPDLRGFGASVDTEGTVSMEDFADDLAAILDDLHVHQPVVLCGLSMGGYIAFHFVRKYRQRLRGLVLCDTRASADVPEVVENRLRIAKLVIESGTQPVAEAMLPKAFSPKTFADRPEVVEAVRGMMISSDPTGVAAASRGMAVRPDMTPLLATIDLPTLVVVGADDGLTPVEEMRRMASAIPAAQFKIIPEAGHLSPLENPPVFNATLASFLDAL